MSLPVIADTYRCALHWVNTFSTSPPEAVNVVHVRTTTEDEAGIGAIWNTVLTDNATEAIFNLSSVFQLQLVQVTKLDGSSGAVDVSVDGPFGGTGSDYICQGAEVVSLKTGSRGPQARGRIYLGPIAEGATENGAIPSSATTAEGWEAIRGDLAAAGTPLVVASYAHSVSRTVISCSVKPFLRTQRRRAPH